MVINWQDVFYFTASLAMIVVFIAGIWFVWLLFITSRLIKNIISAAHKWNEIAEDIEYFRKGIKYKIIRFLLKISNKEGYHEQQ